MSSQTVIVVVATTSAWDGSYSDGDYGYTPPEQKDFFYHLAIVIYIIVLFFSLFINSLMLTVILKDFRNFSQKPFFLFLFQLVIANLFAVASNIYCSLPVVLFVKENHVSVFVESGTYVIFNAFENFSDQLVQFLILLIAIHRFFVFVLPQHTDGVFTKTTNSLLLIFIWLFSTLVAVSFAWLRCSFKFAKEKRHFLFTCDGFEDVTTKQTIFMGYMIQKAVFPVIALVLYVLIFLKLMSQRHGSTSSANKQLLQQTVLIFIVFQVATVATICSLTFPLKESLVFLTKRVTSTIELLAGALCPLFVILISKEVRRRFRFTSSSRPKFNHQAVVSTMNTSTKSRDQKRVGNLPRKVVFA